MKPRQWWAIQQDSTKWKIDSMKVNCFNFSPYIETTKQNQTAVQSMPNVYLECVVDNEKILPGYNRDFKALDSGEQDMIQDTGDSALRQFYWNFSGMAGSNSDDTHVTAMNVMLYNHPGLQFISQTDDFHYEWHAKKDLWRHAAHPWGTNRNESQWYGNHYKKGNDQDYRHEQSWFYDDNLGWGGMPNCGNMPISLNDNTTPPSASTQFDPGHPGITRVDRAGSIHFSQTYPGFNPITRNDDGSANWMNTVFVNAGKRMMTGLPIEMGEEDVPALILFRAPDVPVNDTKVKWSFYATYSVTITYQENQMGYWPLRPTNECGWTGGNMWGMVTAPVPNIGPKQTKFMTYSSPWEDKGPFRDEDRRDTPLYRYSLHYPIPTVTKGVHTRFDDDGEPIKKNKKKNKVKFNIPEITDEELLQY